MSKHRSVLCSGLASSYSETQQISKYRRIVCSGLASSYSEEQHFGLQDASQRCSTLAWRSS